MKEVDGISRFLANNIPICYSKYLVRKFIYVYKKEKDCDIVEMVI